MADQRAVNRRLFLKLIGAGLLVGSGTLAYQRWLEHDSLENQSIARPYRIGTTFSQLQCKYLGLDFRETFRAVQTMGFDVIRLCSYWNEIQTEKTTFDYSSIDWLLNASADADWEIILSVGMKSPRWPEFHFPTWIVNSYDTNRSDVPLDAIPGLGDEALHYINRLVEHTGRCPGIKYWHIENESLNRAPVAAGRFLSANFLGSEIDLVRQHINPSQRILLTFGVDPPFAIQSAEQMLTPILPKVDAVGFDVYAKVPTGFGFFDYVEAQPPLWANLKRWKSFVKGNAKQSLITESQAEPWEPNRVVAIDSRSYTSSDPGRAVRLSSRLASLDFDTVSLWGCEYWYWQKKMGNDEWWDTVTDYIQR